eukprot:CAMPEP_0184689434 /NCGR_PEP_ID=MMETSP0312-20130426/30652_1 /TAXON_ID=31354 /ORGANISM="Compsopogon coeruleus, Strain SAG 36.94" /LENGTH=314 /DNA_ID=CAMNT_0027146779 /DNA_START=111 /DNA_END=1056 /DNA_ORIENTATION=+
MAQQLNRFLEERLRVALQGDLGVQGRIPLTVLAWLFVDLRAGIAPRVTQTALDRSLVMRGSLESCSLPRGPLQPLSKSENAEQFALFLPEHDLSRWVLGWELLVGDQVDLVEPRVGRDACKAPTPVESFARSAHRNGKGRKSFSITLRWASSHIDILISREQILPVSWAHLRFELTETLSAAWIPRYSARTVRGATHPSKIVLEGWIELQFFGIEKLRQSHTSVEMDRRIWLASFHGPPTSAASPGHANTFQTQAPSCSRLGLVWSIFCLRVIPQETTGCRCLGLREIASYFPPRLFHTAPVHCKWTGWESLQP